MNLAEPTRASSAARHGWWAPTSRPGTGGNRFNHEPKRDRKLLLHRVQIDQLLGKTKAKGLTAGAAQLYIDDRGRAKVELGLARGKQLHDRRHDIAERDARRDMERQLADVQRGALNPRRSNRRSSGIVDVVGMRGLDRAGSPENASRGCRQASLIRRQNEVTGNRQPALAIRCLRQ